VVTIRFNDDFGITLSDGGANLFIYRGVPVVESTISRLQSPVNLRTAVFLQNRPRVSRTQ
jgi:hypothetical protein